MPSSGLGAYSVKIHQFIFGGLFVLLVLVGVKAMMSGNSQNIKLLAAASVLFSLVLVMDKYYWLLCPVFVGTRIAIPGLPFDASELGCISLIVVYFIRNAMHEEHSLKYDFRVLIAFPVLAWILMVWSLNPTGLAIFGSSAIGARFYAKIVLGFFSLLVLSTLRLTEKDCKILFFCLCSTSLFSFALSLATHGMSSIENEMEMDVAGVGSRYYLLGALGLYTLMFSRYRTSQILTSLVKMLLTGCFAVFVILSGKRRGFGSLVIIPMLRSLLVGRDKLVTAVCIVILGFTLAMAVAGHGSLWELPKSSQRALSVVVPKFASGSAMGTTDLFRQEVHRYAKQIISQHPWIGRGEFSMSRGETAWILNKQTHASYSGHAYSGNWHGLWVALLADFGIPAAILFGFFFCSALWISFKTVRMARDGTFYIACAMYYALIMFLDFIFSKTSGHASFSFMAICLNYGMILAIRNGCIDKMKARVEPGGMQCG